MLSISLWLQLLQINKQYRTLNNNNIFYSVAFVNGIVIIVIITGIIIIIELELYYSVLWIKKRGGTENRIFRMKYHFCMRESVTRNR